MLVNAIATDPGLVSDSEITNPMPEPMSSGTVTEVVTCSSAILSVSTTGVNPRSCEMAAATFKTDGTWKSLPL